MRHHIEVRLNGVLVSEYHDARRNEREGYIGLENAGNNLMYRHVRITELAPDTVAPTVTVDVPERVLRGAEVPARFACADESELASCVATADGAPITAGANLPTATAGPHVLEVVATDAEGHMTTRRVTYHVDAWVTGTVGGSVPATLSLTLGAPASFPAFIPGVTNEYTATTTVTVTSSAGDATLSVSDPGRLANGAFTLAEPLRVAFSQPAWTGPAANETVDITFRQRITRTDPLRTGTYAKTLTFTLATTNP